MVVVEWDCVSTYLDEVVQGVYVVSQGNEGSSYSELHGWDLFHQLERILIIN
jgi:hypothetical protein